MTAGRVTALAALVGGLGWLVKVALIWGNGGTNTDEGIVAVFYFVGLLGLVAACAAAGAWLTASRPLWLRVVAAVVGLVAFFGVFALLDAVLSPLAPEDGWFADEVEIVGAGVLGLVLAAVAWRSVSADRPVGEPVTRRPARRD